MKYQLVPKLEFLWIILVLLNICKGSFDRFLQSIPPNYCDVIYLSSSLTKPSDLFNSLKLSHVIQIWKISTFVQVRFPGNARKYNPFCGCTLYDGLTVENFSLLPLAWNLLHGTNILISDNLPKQIFYPADHMMKTLIVTRRGNLIQGVDPTATAFETFGFPYFSRRTNFGGKALLWGQLKHMPMSLQDMESYREQRGQLDTILSLLHGIRKTLNATIRLSVFPNHPTSADQKSWHLYTAMPLSPTISSIGYTVDHCVWDGLSFFVRKPYPNAGHQHLSTEIFGDPVVIVGCLISVMLISIILNHQPAVTSSGLGTMCYQAFLQIQLCIDQSLPDSILRYLRTGNSGRIAVAPFLLAAIVFTTQKQTDVVTQLTAPDIYFPPRTFSELLDSDYKLFTAGRVPSIIKGLATAGNNVAMNLDGKARHLVGLPGKKEGECMLHTWQNKRQACVLNYLGGLVHGLMTVGGNNAWELPLDASKELLGSLPIVLTVNPRMLHILDEVRHVTSAYSESGIMYFLRSRTMETRLQIGRRKQKSNETSRNLNLLDMPRSQDKPKIILAIYLMIRVTAGSLLLFGIEKATHRVRNNVGCPFRKI